jgi:hypothetical protein
MKVLKFLIIKNIFQINAVKQARNALSRGNQYNTVPEWYDGTLEELVKKVNMFDHLFKIAF